MKYYVYTLIDSRDGSIFYVGKGTKRRCYSHLSETANTTYNMIKFNKIQSIRNHGYEPIVNIVQHFYSSSEAYEAEKQLISEIGLNNLTNIHPGGQGGSGNGSWKGSGNPSHKSKGLTYEQIYGPKKAKQLRQSRSVTSSNRLITDEWKTKMSDSAKKRDHSYKQKRVVTPAGTFNSLNAAANHYNINPSTLNQRMKSIKNKNKFYYE